MTNVAVRGFGHLFSLMMNNGNLNAGAGAPILGGRGHIGNDLGS